MIRFVLTLALLGSSSAFAAPAPTWSKKMVDDLKTKTLQQTFCDNSPGFQTKAACDYFGKDKKELSKKLISVSAQGNVLTLSDGKLTVEIKRLKDELQFEVNRKLIDVGELRVPAKLVEALSKALPKLAARSMWINVANAEEFLSKNHELLANASALILIGSVDGSTCEAVVSFSEICSRNVAGFSSVAEMERIENDLNKSAGTEKSAKAKELEERNNAWYLEHRLNVLVLVGKMKEITRGLASRRPALRACVDGEGNDATKYLDACLNLLKRVHIEYRDKTCKSDTQKSAVRTEGSKECQLAKSNISKFDIEEDVKAKSIEKQSEKNSAIK